MFAEMVTSIKYEHAPLSNDQFTFSLETLLSSRVGHGEAETGAKTQWNRLPGEELKLKRIVQEQNQLEMKEKVELAFNQQSGSCTHFTTAHL